MKISKEARKVSRQLFRASFTNGQLDEAKASESLARLIASKPRNLHGTLSQFQRLLRLEVQKRHALVESATPLTPDLGAEVISDLEKRYGSGITSEFRLNPELIGGVRVRIGSDVWDGSVRGRLERLEQELSAT